MCTTPWCAGECDDCQDDREREDRQKDNETCQFSGGGAKFLNLNVGYVLLALSRTAVLNADLVKIIN